MKSFLKILACAFLGILFFQINIVAAGCTYVRQATINSCEQSSIDMVTSDLSKCVNLTSPPSCVSDPTSCFCCCDKPTLTPASPASTQPKSGGIQFTPQVQGLTYTFNSADKTTGNIANYIKAIYQYAIGIVGILAAVVLMYGGVLWIVAGGSSSQVGEAKAWIGAALTGLILALTSYLILNTINPALVNLQTSTIPSVAEFTNGSCITPEAPFCIDNISAEECTKKYGSFTKSGKCPIGSCTFIFEGSNKCLNLTEGECSKYSGTFVTGDSCPTSCCQFYPTFNGQTDCIEGPSRQTCEAMGSNYMPGGTYMTLGRCKQGNIRGIAYKYCQ